MANLVTIPILSGSNEFSEKTMPTVKATWHNKVNDFVENGAIICDLETDKLIMEFESPCSGYILFISDKTHANYNDILCVIGDQGETYTQLIDAYEKNRPLEVEVPKKSSFTTEDTIKPLSNEKKDSGNGFFKWLKNLFK